MLGNEVTVLRKQGKLTEAYTLAISRLQGKPFYSPERTDLAFVYYDFLKQGVQNHNSNTVFRSLEKILTLKPGPADKILSEALLWQLGKFIQAETRCKNSGKAKYTALHIITLMETVVFLPSRAYSFFFSVVHRILKDEQEYLRFADWWIFDNFTDEDYLATTLPEGTEIQANAYSGYITYAKHLLKLRKEQGGRESSVRVREFIHKAKKVYANRPEYVFLNYYLTRLHLSVYEKEEAMALYPPFLKLKKNEFWAWQVFSEIYAQGSDEEFAILCRALLCSSTEKMLSGIRFTMACRLFDREEYDAAKTELSIIIAEKQADGLLLPEPLRLLARGEWFEKACTKKDNTDIYKKYASEADKLLYGEIKEITVAVQRVNTEKKILHFYGSESCYGFCKYTGKDPLPRPGDLYKICPEEGTPGGFYRMISIKKISEPQAGNTLLEKAEGIVKISEGKTFGFVHDIFIPPAVITQYKLKNGDAISGIWLKEYNKSRNCWGKQLCAVHSKKSKGEPEPVK